MESIAHIRRSDKKIQTVEQHLIEVRKLAESYGTKVGIPHITGLAGVLHDMGKFSCEFTSYIKEALENPNSPPKRGSVDHSTAGGKLLFEMFHHYSSDPLHQVLTEVVGNAILSHHSYLQDFISPELESNFLYRVTQKEFKEFDQSKEMFFSCVMNQHEFSNYVDIAKEELRTYLSKHSTSSVEQKLMFLTKYVFSSLIDADRTNTRLFEDNVQASPDQENLFLDYYQQLIVKVNSFKKLPNSKSPINQLRAKMSEQCDLFAENQSGIYTLSIPTGGGKTLASLRYALKHAILHNKKRIIYIVPFTTIIEQNAEEVRKILMDDEHILEHHSNVVAREEEDDEREAGFINAQQKLKLAKDNWDSPIIFTTMVQFLNVFYAHGSRNIRRLHNLSDSILIFDEVQKVPISCVTAFNQALNFLKSYGNSSIILCTATQPALNYVEKKLEIETESEIIENIDEVVEAFKRVEIIDKATDQSFRNDQLVDFIESKLEEVNSILTILNTKSAVRDLYEKMQENQMGIHLFHLSTAMCPAHRNQMLNEIRTLLLRGERVVCISTQLIEAGVDLSFECVIRSLAGLDSIAQAAGRCNRHGEKEKQFVYLIDYSEENLTHLKEIQVGKKISKRILIDLKKDKSNYGGDILSKQAMDKFFKEYYLSFISNLNYPISKLGIDMNQLLNANKAENSFSRAYKSKHGEEIPLFIRNSYKTAAEHFHVIENQTTSVIVPFKEGKEIIAELNGANSIEDLSKLMRKAQQYMVNLYKHEMDKLTQNGGLISYFDGSILAITDGAYDQEFGLNVNNDSQMGFQMC
ncbi:CRISPR-associated helicase Cas3' [Bacillaceae bacterium S4-13-58]